MIINVENSKTETVGYSIPQKRDIQKLTFKQYEDASIQQTGFRFARVRRVKLQQNIFCRNPKCWLAVLWQSIVFHMR